MVLTELIKKGSLTKTDSATREANISNLSKISISKALTKKNDDSKIYHNIKRLCKYGISGELKVQNVTNTVAKAKVANLAKVSKANRGPSSLPSEQALYARFQLCPASRKHASRCGGVVRGYKGEGGYR